MEEHLRSVVGTLSKGQRQRIGLAVALLPDPEVLILDEPTSGLDPLQRIEVRRLVGELACERTVLLSSHILPEVEAICPRTIILHRGRVVADGTREELERRFGTDASSVRVELRVGGEGEVSAEGVRAALAELPGAGAVAMRESADRWCVFEISCGGDLRDEVGGLARERGWHLRELSREGATLERLFARIAFDENPIEGEENSRAGGSATGGEER
jgi:ABC-2 type transport system ATP-binding protein